MTTRVAAAAALLFALPALADNVAVTTQHNNNARTGANLQETVLTAFNVVPGQFGRIWQFPASPATLAGRVSGQPLYVPNLTILNQGVHNTLFVATSNNEVFALDADTGAQLWGTSLNDPPGVNTVDSPPSDLSLSNGCTVASGGAGCNDKPKIGVMSTPVIDLQAGLIYVVSKHHLFPSGAYTFFIHALELSSGFAHWPKREISGSVPGHLNNGQPTTVTFDPAIHNQRTGLLLANNMVYAGFGSWQDTPGFHGWIFAFPKDLSSPSAPLVFCTTPHDFLGNIGQMQGGIWQAGAGLVADSGGQIYFMSGNGTSGEAVPGQINLAQSYVKLDANLNHVGHLTDWTGNAYDADLGSSGPILLSGNRLLGAGKTGTMHVVSTINMVDAQIPPIQVTTQQPFYTSHHIHGSPVFWSNNGTNMGFLYIWPEDETLKRYTWDGNFITNPSNPSLGPQGPSGMPGGSLSISANGSTAGSAVLWVTIPTAEDALHDNVPGTLYAFNAAGITYSIWNSEIDPPNNRAGILSKGANPTIANGKVFVGAQDHVNAYGIICVPATSCPPNFQCGLFDVGCGVVPMNCGSCSSPYTCVNNTCVCPAATCGTSCGQVCNSCGNCITCGCSGTKVCCEGRCQTQACN
jgi:outer membrane protein assembly factor BamB